MPKNLQKSLRDYLNKIKIPTQNSPFPSNSFSAKKSWILSACKHPKTLSFAIDNKFNKKEGHEDGDTKRDDAATLSDVDRFLFENFRSLYIKNDEDQDYQMKVKEGDHHDQAQNPDRVLFDHSPRFGSPPPDLCRSHRFFVASGSSSGSLIEEARSSLTATSEDMVSSSTSTNTVNDSITTSINEVKNVRLPDDSIAVLTYSRDPYEDFRQSMLEIVQERLQNSGKVDWDFMEEVLLCFLNLNEKKSHKFILSAFVDLTVSLQQNSEKAPGSSRNSRIARERRNKLKNVT